MAPKWNPLPTAFMGKLLLAFCLLGLAAASASASTVFLVNGTLDDGSPFSGTLTIDPTGGTITAESIVIGAPSSDTCTGIFNQFTDAPHGYFVDLNCASGFHFHLVLGSDPAGDLLGYAGGPIVTGLIPPAASFYTGPGDPHVAAGAVTQGGSFQVRYASNLVTGADAVIDVTNTGASATTITLGVGQNNIDGNICVNVYTFSADEQEVALLLVFGYSQRLVFGFR